MYINTKTFKSDYNLQTMQFILWDTVIYHMVWVNFESGPGGVGWQGRSQQGVIKFDNEGLFSSHGVARFIGSSQKNIKNNFCQ